MFASAALPLHLLYYCCCGLSVVIETYRNAFQYLRFGYASAMAFTLAVVIGLFSFLLVRAGGMREEPK